jgi:hypothetical protein
VQRAVEEAVELAFQKITACQTKSNQQVDQAFEEVRGDN